MVLMSNQKAPPVVLIILDGWGTAPATEGNAITRAKTPNFNRLVANYQTMTLKASGEEVGLLWGQMGNSEVGHLNIGAGKIFYQTLPRINKSISDGEFFNNQVFLKAIKHVKANRSKLHLLGLTSSGGVHSSQEHLYALLKLAKKERVKEVYVHAILDGRDSLRDSGIDFITKLEEEMKKTCGKIATLSGRFYAMDRDNRWDRVALAYKAMVMGESQETDTDSKQAVEKSYSKKIYDEEFVPEVMMDGDKPMAKISDNDAVIFFNFRADRARQLTQAFVNKDFDKFDRGQQLKKMFFATMTEYESGLPVNVAYPPELVKNTLAEVLSSSGLKQLHIAETEKYAHITFFFNGEKEEPFSGEDRVIIPSPKVADYSTTPEMSAKLITKRLIKEINTDKYAFIAVNFANADMVGHTGNMEATIKAVEAIDKCLGDIVDLVTLKDGVVIITADHGNAEELVNLQTGGIDKEHSTNPVPFIIVGKDWEKKESVPQVEGSDFSLMVEPQGILADVAPTILKVMKIKQPKEMSGKALV